MSPTDDRIVFLSVPQSLAEKIGSTDDFSIDTSIPIPVEIPPGETELRLEELSWEMILSGMLRVIASDMNGKNADYFRRFVLSVRPNIRGEFTEAAILKARNGDHAMAMEILNAIQGLFPDLGAIKLNRAIVLEEWAESAEKAGREAEAEEKAEAAFSLYRELIGAEIPLPEALYNAGFFYMKRNNFEKARDCFEQFEACTKDQEKRERAHEIVREIEERQLDDTFLKEAYDAIRMGEEEKGIEKIRDFLRREPAVWNGWFILGWGLRRLSRWEDAEAAFRKAIELGGTGCDTHNELAICRMEQGDLTEARRELEKALSIETENIKVISNMGIVALRGGHPEDAKGFFRAVLDLSPEDPVATHYLSTL